MKCEKEKILSEIEILKKRVSFLEQVDNNRKLQRQLSCSGAAPQTELERYRRMLTGGAVGTKRVGDEGGCYCEI